MLGDLERQLVERFKRLMRDQRVPYLLAAGRGTRTAVNRAYYAAFYAVLALLQTLGKTPRKHRGAIGLFDTEFIRTGLLLSF